MELESCSLVIWKGRAFVEAGRVEKSWALSLSLVFRSTRREIGIISQLTHFE